jgi:biopolymer transport protein ExbD
MARVKVPRKSTAIDMTAMCDVAFLLLTFFILSAKPRTEDPVHIDTPASTMKVPVPDDNLATLTVGQGKVFFGVEGTDIRKQTLQQMGEKYSIKFTPEEAERFSVLNNFGVPIANLKQFLAMDPDQKKAFAQPGIPTDTTANSELFNWVREARLADRALKNKDLRISIKGDSKEEYPTIKMIITLLQKQKVNKFSLITSLKADPKK